MRLLTMLMGLLLMTCCAATVEVRTVEEFAAAWEQAKTADTQIIVRESLDFAGRTFGLPAHATTAISIRGARPGIELTANCWTADPAVPPQASAFVYFDHDRVMLSDVTIRNYDQRGAAIRLSNAQHATIIGCRFERIGISAYAPMDRTTDKYPFNAAAFVFANVIGGWGGNQSVLIADCAFVDCCTGNEYGHCVYVVGDDVEVRGCTVERCGQPFQCSGQRVSYVNNVVRDPALTNQRWLKLHIPFVFYVGGAETLISGNRLIGEFGDVCYGTAADKLVLTGNNYSEVTITGSRPAED